VTRIEEVLRVLSDQPRGLTAADIHGRTGVSRNVLGTYLWELKRDGYIQRVGGTKGTYRYGLAPKGRDRLAEAHELDWEDKNEHVLPQVLRVAEQRGVQDFQETLKVIDRLSEYRTLKKFCEWILVEDPMLFADLPAAPANLHRLMLQHLGVDPTTYRKQSKVLIGLLEFMQEEAES
jgi:DNA-binding HxlR family transcriptional regulator